MEFNHFRSGKCDTVHRAFEDNQTCPRVTVFNFGHFSGSRTTTTQVDGCEGPM